MLAVKEYNRLVNRKKEVGDLIAKTQRQRDLKVDTINKNYERRLDIMIREESELDIVITNTKKFIENN